MLPAIFILLLWIASAFSDEEPSCNNPELMAEIESNELVKYTNVHLYTPYNRSCPFYMCLHESGKTKELLKEGKFDPRLETKFILPTMHRSIDQRGESCDEIKDGLLDQGVYNIFCVDYYALTQDDFKITFNSVVFESYFQSMLIARFICHIQIITGISPMSIHLIGHGIGAQIAGNIGSRIPNLGRISALDPSGVFFYNDGANSDDDHRLDRSDALQVDAIHTNADSYLDVYRGTMHSVGHIDFYPNGGKNQPGCEGKDLCNHLRAIHLYINSIKHRCCLVGEVCCDWDSYVTGRCYVQTPKKIELGFNTIIDTKYKDSLRVCLRTRDKDPYCNQVWLGQGAEKPNC